MAEWLKAPLSKSGIGETLSEVRILPLPHMVILGIETSCDETAVSVVEANGDLESLEFTLLGSALHSQVEIHEKYGGVFPTLAKREHIKNLPLVYKNAVEKSGISEKEIELITVTVGPGLEPALWAGINFAKELGERIGVKTVAANHMLGHITSVLFNTDAIKNKNIQIERKNEKIRFPALALLISGGHTELVYLKNWKNREKIGKTKDDAVGEAFDKVARMLNLPYPGGPKISKLAEEAREKNLCLDHKFPRPMIHSGDLNFSFSGLKTAVLYYLRKLTSPPTPPSDNTEIAVPPLLGKERGLGGEVVIPEKTKLEIAREFEDAVVETLITKTKKAMEIYNPKTLIVGGGVIANKEIRKNILELKNIYKNIEILLPEKSLSTDNATMIAAAGYIDLINGVKISELKADGNLELD